MWEEAPLDASIRASIDEFARAYESGAPARAIAAFQAARRSRKERESRAVWRRHDREMK